MKIEQAAKKISLSQDPALQTRIHGNSRDIGQYLVATRNALIKFIEGPAITRKIGRAQLELADVGDGSPGALTANVITLDVQQYRGKTHVTSVFQKHLIA